MAAWSGGAMILLQNSSMQSCVRKVRVQLQVIIYWLYSTQPLTLLTFQGTPTGPHVLYYRVQL